MRVEFHTDVADPPVFACRLLRKAYRSGAKIAVFAPPTLLARIDQTLWTLDAREFIPHARWAGPPRQPGSPGLVQSPFPPIQVCVAGTTRSPSVSSAGRKAFLLDD